MAVITFSPPLNVSNDFSNATVPSSSSRRHLSHARSRVFLHLPNNAADKTRELSRKWRVGVSFLSGFLDRSAEIESLKEDLLEEIAPLDRGAAATSEDQQRVDQRPKLLRPNGKIYQAINLDTLRAHNMETWPFLNQATANLVPLNARRVAVKFDSFKIAALIPIKSRGSGRGQIEITYLDEELRITRGNEGNLFILKMVDPSYRVPL